MKTISSEINIEELNASYANLSPLERLAKFYKEFGDKNILVSSSFGTTSAYLLDLISKTNRKQEIHLINTGYLFKETLDYAEDLSLKLGLNIKTIKPDFHHHQYTAQNRTWEKDPNLCCSVNKVLPFEEIKKGKDFWISGLIGKQSHSRKDKDIFERNGDIIKFHPIIDIELEDVKTYLSKNNLPTNPLFHKGYESVGCFHCTAKGKGRSGRWKSSTKTECGLHLPSEKNMKAFAVS
ncbi:MAG: phosphoadenylyl-sulfate reductase [Thalassobius sp.]|nr:phosphoadenylyl-sulfate reductase [Thalassovita sp.]